jgi:DNA-binding PadR family transcriptional regulator
MIEEYGHIPDGFLLNPEEVEELRNKKYELTEYGKQKLRELLEKQKKEDEINT